jgi:GT2 family glycosyltransferase
VSLPGAGRRTIRLVVLNYNGGSHTLRCLEHLRNLDWQADELDLVVVDNASSDGSPEQITERFPEVRIVRNDRNGGFPANNLAMGDLDDVRYLGLVNNDAFVEPDYLVPLVEALDADPGLGAACPKLLLAPRFADVRISAPGFRPGGGDGRDLGVMVRGATVDGVDVWRDAHLGEGGWGREADADGTFEWSAPEAALRLPAPEGGGGTAFRASVVLQARETTTVVVDGGADPVEAVVGRDPVVVTLEVSSPLYDVINNVGSQVFDDGAGADRGWLERDLGQHDQPVEVFAWCGGGVLFRPEYLRDVGLFDDRFFLYYEDTDLSWRGQARGWRYRTAPASVIRHLHAASSVEGSEVFAYHVERNRLLMLVKDAPRQLVLRQVWRYLLVTASYARRDLARPLLAGHRPRLLIVRRRTISFVGFLRLLPTMVSDRRLLRRRQLVPDAELQALLVPR